MRYYPLEKFIDLFDGYRRSFRVDNHQLLLLQENGQIYLFDAHCPHRGHPLIEASVSQGRLHCPLHHYEFELTNGAVSKTSVGPCRALRRYEVVERATDVGVML